MTTDRTFTEKRMNEVVRETVGWILHDYRQGTFDLPTTRMRLLSVMHLCNKLDALEAYNLALDAEKPLGAEASGPAQASER